MATRLRTWLGMKTTRAAGVSFVALITLVVLFPSGCANDHPGIAAAPPIGQESQAAMVCPSNVVEGIDVSDYQGAPNWGSVKGAGIDFAFIKATQGTYNTQSSFAGNWSGSKAAGVIRGAYHFFDPTQDGAAQAQHFLSVVGTIAPDDLPPMLDIECPIGCPDSCGLGCVSGSTVVSRAQAWLDAVQSATGRKPVIYSFYSFFGSIGAPSSWGGYPLFIASPNSCASVPSPWTTTVFWQYGTAAVSGISGAVDRDRFIGTLSELQQFVGGFDWGAQFVSQSFPLASQPPLIMHPGESVPAYIELKNIGSKSWDQNTKIGTTQPRDRVSVFAAPDWLANNRPSHVASGTIAPGASYKFQFTFQAPQTTGMYKEYFGVVQEGVNWFSDPGEGGPPDNDLEALIQVEPYDWAAQIVNTSYTPGSTTPIVMAPGSTLPVTIELKNIGGKSWDQNTKIGTTQPHDRMSVFAGSDWLSPSRPANVAMGTVAPGSSYTFKFTLHAPQTTGDYHEGFGVVEEAVHWFSDSGEGGPSDTALDLFVHVGTSAGAGGTSGAGGASSGVGGASGAGGSSSGVGGSGGSHSSGGSAGSTINLGPGSNSNSHSSGGCSVEPTTDPSRSLLWALGVLGTLVTLRRRRESRS